MDTKIEIRGKTLGSPEVWKFHAADYDHWCDGDIWELREGRDYPAGITTEKVLERIRTAAYRRQALCRTWLYEGSVRFVMVPAEKVYGPRPTMGETDG